MTEWVGSVFHGTLIWYPLITGWRYPTDRGIKGGHVEIARLLLEGGAQANIANKVGTCISISISL